jgi:threonine aldolase
MPSPHARWFASDNCAAVHHDVMQALTQANSGHALAYGHDPFTEESAARVASHFGDDAAVSFVFNGTAANVLAISALLRPHEAVICADCSHLHTDECGATERFAGSKLLPVAAPDGKIIADSIARATAGKGVEHHVQPRLVSITQATEYGTVYAPNDVRTIAETAHDHEMYLHIDGARLSNAAASLDISLKGLTTDCGADVVSLGGTKNGIMFGEAVVFLEPRLANGFKFVRKQGMQLASKMRFIGAQFAALYGSDLWLRNARHANAMASLLAERVSSVQEVEITRPVQANAVFARLPRQSWPRLQAEWPFHAWDESRDEVRWMTSWDTTPEEVTEFAEAIEKALR